ncbi:glycosyltransferase [Staphylococcus hominis]|uniref:Glycosyltransferase n=1 Tax=Staphylococcus hominis TaxID=1290 RepID=A0A6N0I3I2_STAHO|nr:glycosyltransferase [Staphylococcus hominis]
MKIRVIIPCFNEGKVVKKTYDRLTEILTENSKLVVIIMTCYLLMMVVKIIRLSIYKFSEYDEHVKYISFSRNFGKEAAMIAGFQHSVNVDAVVMIDGDLQHPPEFIPKMLKCINKV